MKRFVLVLFLIPVGLFAQQVTNFKLVNVVNDQTISLESYPSCEGMVIVFTSNECPYDEYYRARLTALSRSFQERVPFVLVNAHPDPAESKEAMKSRARQWNLSLPYLADKDQTLMQQLDARKSPEVFLLKNQGGKFAVVYRGAIDDNPQVAADVRHHYLKDAIDIMLSRQTIETPEVRPVGCTLRKK